MYVEVDLRNAAVSFLVKLDLSKNSAIRHRRQTVKERRCVPETQIEQFALIG